MAKKKKEAKPEKDDSVLASLVDCEAQLSRLLKAEQNEWVGVIGRRGLRQIAEELRSELAKTGGDRHDR